MAKYTNADLAHDVARLLTVVAGESAQLAHGMWNPKFCEANAEDQAAGFIDMVKTRLANIEHRIAEKARAA